MQFAPNNSDIASHAETSKSLGVTFTANKLEMRLIPHKVQLIYSIYTTKNTNSRIKFINK